MKCTNCGEKAVRVVNDEWLCLDCAAEVFKKEDETIRSQFDGVAKKIKLNKDSFEPFSSFLSFFPSSGLTYIAKEQIGVEHRCGTDWPITLVCLKSPTHDRQYIVHEIVNGIGRGIMKFKTQWEALDYFNAIVESKVPKR